MGCSQQCTVTTRTKDPHTPKTPIAFVFWRRLDNCFTGESFPTAESRSGDDQTGRTVAESICAGEEAQDGRAIRKHRKRGAAGVVTDGGFRDSPEIARMTFPAYHHRPSAPTNLTLHQALDINVPIGCGDVPVWPGDVVVGDGEGVIVIEPPLSTAS